MCRLTFIARATLPTVSALLALNSKNPLPSSFRSPAFSPELPVVPLRIYDSLPLACRRLRRWTRCPSSGTSRSKGCWTRSFGWGTSSGSAWSTRSPAPRTPLTAPSKAASTHWRPSSFSSATTISSTLTTSSPPAASAFPPSPSPTASPSSTTSSAATPLPTPSNSFPPSSAAQDVEEYRPDDPSFLSNDPNSAAADQSKFPDEPDASVLDDRRSLEYLAMIRALEQPLKDREAILECRNRDFYGVLVASTRREEERQQLESQQRKDGLIAKTCLIGSDDRAGGDDFDGAVPKPKMHL